MNGSALTVTFDGGLDTASVPAASAFTVKATRGGTERDVSLAATSPVAVGGSTATLTLAEAVLAIDTVTVAYDAPATGKLQDADGQKLPVTGFADTKTAANATPADTTRPAFVSATANGNTVTLTYDEALKESASPGKFDYWLEHSGGSRRPFGTPSVSGRTVTMQVGNSSFALRHDQSIRFSYIPPANTANRIQDLSGNFAVAIGQWGGIDNVTPPAYQSASVNGTALTLTFDGGLDETSVPAASAFTVKATFAGTERSVAWRRRARWPSAGRRRR